MDPSDPIGVTLHTGVRVALERLLDLLGTDQPALGPAHSVYEGIGVGEFRSGRALESVLAAYRVGATATWRTFSTAAVRAELDPATIADLAQACFAYIDEIASASAAGYARAQSRDAGQREARTRGLIERVLAGQADTPTTRELAREIGWAVPEYLRVALLVDRIAAPPMGVAAAIDEGGFALLPAVSSQAAIAQWGRSLGRGWAAVGAPVPRSQAAASRGHAQVLRLAREAGGVPPQPVMFAEDHLPALILAATPDLVRLLRRRMLAPLEGIAPDRAVVLEETLRSWLLHDGSRSAVAADLTVHPQTVAYRMERVRDLFGEALTDPAERWALRLATMATSDRGNPGDTP